MTTFTVGFKSWSPQKLSAALLACLFIIETLTFYWTVVRNISPFYPINFDQLSYYFDSYTILEKGWLGVIDEFIRVKHAASVAFTAQGAMLGLLFGANRTVILSLNLIYFLFLQLALFRSILGCTRRLEIAWLSIALLISCQTIFYDGGIYDFRIDFSALCLYGIWICSILWSEIFRYTGRSLIVAAAAIMLILLRSIVVLYVAAILSGLLTIFVWSMFKGNSHFDRDLARLRVRNLLAAGVVIAVFIVPLLLNSIREIYDYYVIGHVLGDEKYVWAHELGLYTVLDHILYYPKSICEDHLGWQSIALMLFAFVITGGFIRPWLRMQVIFQRLRGYALDFIVIGFAVLLPYVMLTADIAKSPVVGGIVVVPIVTLVAFLCAVFWLVGPREKAEQAAAAPVTVSVPAKNSTASFNCRPEFLRAVSVVVAVMIGLGCFVVRGLTPPNNKSLSDLQRITEINEAIDRYVIQNSLTQPSISFDRVTDYLNLPSVRLFAFERFHKIIYFVPLFGNYAYGIFATPRDVAMALIMKSDVIVLTDPVEGRPGYPMDNKITEYWDEIDTWTRKNRTLFYSTVIFDIPHRVYVRSPNSLGNDIK